MNKFKSVIFGSLVILACSALADLKSDTQKKFDSYCVAVKKKDPKAIEKALRDNFAPDFKFVPKKGQPIDLDHWITDEKSMASMTESVKSVTIHIDNVKMGKGSATMKVTLSYEGVAKMDPKGKAGLLKYVAVSDSTMTQKNGKWWITKMKEDSSKTWFNGKPVAM